MHRNKKRVICSGHGPIFCGKQYKSPWEDVWIRWKERRKTKYHAPVLISLPLARFDLSVAEELVKKYPEEKEFRDDLVSLQGIISTLEAGAYYIKDFDKFPTLYTPKDYIDQAEAEKLLSMLLIEHKNLKFDWRRPKIVVTPMG